MADETADISNKEQLVICLRWVDANLEVHEDFIGLNHIEQANADSIVCMILVSSDDDFPVAIVYSRWLNTLIGFNPRFH